MSLPPYFGGSGVDLGTVSALTPQTFDAFVKETLGNPALVKHITRREFIARDKKERDKIKRVAFFVPSVHRGSPIRRAFETAAYCNLICLDVDNSDHARPLIENKGQALVDSLHPYAFAAYTTAASTPEAPRLRVVVKAERIPLDLYPQAVQHVGATLLGLPTVTPESRVAVQPMFLPTLFCDDDVVHQHPLVVAVPEGAAVTSGIVAGTAVPSVRPAQTGSPEDTSLESLAFLRPQVDGVTLEDAEAALEHLDPDCAYHEWISVAAALKHQFGDNGFDLFCDWSSRGEKYTGEDDTRTKWDSFKANPRGRLPITIRSLLKRAAEAGWNRTEQVATRCYEECRAWLLSHQKAEVLMNDGIARIAGLPFVSDIQRNALISNLCDALKRVGVAVTKTELKKSYDRFERRLAKLAQNEKQLAATPDSQMPEWARGFCYVATQDEFFQRHSGRKFAPNVFDSFFGVQLMPKGSDDGAAAPAVRPRDFLLNVLTCPRVDDYAYDPSQPEAIFKDGHKRVVNLYIPSHPEADRTNVEAVGQLLLQHRDHLIKEPEYRQTWFDFFAYLVQHPGKKIRWVPVLQGVHGCGKSAFLDIGRAALGREHVRQVGAEIVMGNFNGWAFGAQLVGIEEIRVVGHNRHEVMNAIKPCVTNDYITVNEKYVVPYPVRNYTNYMMFTNYHDALALSRDERRYFVIFSPMQTRTQVARLGHRYFPTLYEAILTQPGAVRAFFEDWKISNDFNPDGQAPVTKYMEEMARVSGSPLQSSILEIIEANKHVLVQHDIISAMTLAGLLELARVPPFTDQAVTAVLRELGYVSHGRVSLNGTGHNIYALRSVEFSDDPREIARRRLEACDLLD